MKNDFMPHEINISDIISDDSFKISKNNYPVNLTASLKISGMLEIPYVIKTETGYKLLTCHNRIKILRESETASLKCLVLENPDVKIFMNHVSLKAYRNELGPLGKIKTLLILNSFFNLNESEIKNFCTKVLKLPSEIMDNENYLSRVMSFPETLISYIDEKDMSFKVIKDLSSLPSDWIALIDNWLAVIQVRVNIFRMLVDHLFDMHRRGDNISVIESLTSGDDKSLYDNIFAVRYPEFSKLKVKSDSIIKELSAGGLSVDFPEYFDRGFLTLKLDINKKSDSADQLKKISKINIDKLEELLSFL
jgi:hypothetical protein